MHECDLCLVITWRSAGDTYYAVSSASSSRIDFVSVPRGVLLGALRWVKVDDQAASQLQLIRSRYRADHVPLLVALQLTMCHQDVPRRARWDYDGLFEATRSEDSRAGEFQRRVEARCIATEEDWNLIRDGHPTAQYEHLCGIVNGVASQMLCESAVLPSDAERREMSRQRSELLAQRGGTAAIGVSRSVGEAGGAFACVSGLACACGSLRFVAHALSHRRASCDLGPVGRCGSAFPRPEADAHSDACPCSPWARHVGGTVGRGRAVRGREDGYEYHSRQAHRRYRSGTCISRRRDRQVACSQPQLKGEPSRLHRSSRRERTTLWRRLASISRWFVSQAARRTASPPGC